MSWFSGRHNSVTLPTARRSSSINSLGPGEMKWMRMSGLAMLLPHGQEGQGPEHSSGRLERYLQLCAEDNLQVVQPSAPFNYFHALRRQIHRDFRKPLICMTPKSLLRHRLCVSDLYEFAHGDSFHRLLWDRGDVDADEKIKRVVMCSGKVYYDLFEEREKREIRNIYLLRVEQLYPFPEQGHTQGNCHASRRPTWSGARKNPRNMGAWTFINPWIEEALIDIGHRSKRPRYVGRAEMAATGTRHDEAARRATGRPRGRGLDVLGIPNGSRRWRLRSEFPPCGESVTEATVARWFKGIGEPVARDEIICELETDKVALEVPAPAAGTIEAIDAGRGRYGRGWCRVGSNRRRRGRPSGTVLPPATPATAPVPALAKADALLSPAVRRLVEEHGLDPTAITGTGKDGRILNGRRAGLYRE